MALHRPTQWVGKTDRSLVSLLLSTNLALSWRMVAEDLSDLPVEPPRSPGPASVVADRGRTWVAHLAISSTVSACVC
ncbi:MAG: hypothetical protein DRI90_17010 [Deltaproteobacteria bacterium]|nr:MAG: hypothetical protein DRI90_17010 [Deltaproteobacteria bacterium]